MVMRKDAEAIRNAVLWRCHCLVLLHQHTSAHYKLLMRFHLSFLPSYCSSSHSNNNPTIPDITMPPQEGHGQHHQPEHTSANTESLSGSGKMITAKVTRAEKANTHRPRM